MNSTEPHELIQEFRTLQQRLIDAGLCVVAAILDFDAVRDHISSNVTDEEVKKTMRSCAMNGDAEGDTFNNVLDELKRSAEERAEERAERAEAEGYTPPLFEENGE